MTLISEKTHAMKGKYCVHRNYHNICISEAGSSALCRVSSLWRGGNAAERQKKEQVCALVQPGRSGKAGHQIARWHFWNFSLQLCNLVSEILFFKINLIWSMNLQLFLDILYYNTFFWHINEVISIITFTLNFRTNSVWVPGC